MKKNDRPTTYHEGKPTFYNLGAVPPYYASRKEWGRRGFAVKDEEVSSGSVEHWNGRDYLRFELYHFTQCRQVNHEKATERRFRWFCELLNKQD